MASERPNIIFVVVETLRADHLRAWGYGRNTMPIVEDLARDGLIFDRAISAAPWTLPSVASILTGTSPSVHGVRTYEDVIPDDAMTLAEHLSKAGYETAFFGVNSLFEANRNVKQGFDRYYGIDEIPGTQLNEQISGFVRHRTDPRPLFLYIHYFEPHCRYIPPKAMRELYFPPTPELTTNRVITDEQLRSMHECFHLNRRSGEPIYELDYYLAEYDAEIRYVDHLIGLTLEHLKTAGLYDQSLLAVLGDHGEEFWEHGTFGHGRSLNEPAIHVPMVIRPPGGTSPTRVKAPVSTMDLAPTALALAGLPVPEVMQGVNLAPIWQEADMSSIEGRPVFSETDYETFHFRSIHDGALKLIMPVEGGSPSLYNLSSDPAQLSNLAKEHPDDVVTLSKRLDAHLAESVIKAREIGTASRPLDDTIIERLKALGYTF